MNGTFYEQLGGVAGVFEQWGACERTVVACALARRVPWPGIKLVQAAVEAALQSHAEDERLEREANDEVLIASLLSLRPDDDDDEGNERLRHVVRLLPLLRADNEPCKEVFVRSAGALVQRCVDARRPAVVCDLARQILSYLLVHPAVTPQDHATLSQWLRYLEKHMSGRATEIAWPQRAELTLPLDLNIWSAKHTFRRTIGKNVEFRGVDADAYDLHDSFSKNGRDVELEERAQPKSQRSNSLTPSSEFMHTSSSAENLSEEPLVQKPRSFSLSSEHSLGVLRPLRPLGLYGVTNSETRLDELRCGSRPGLAPPGMAAVAHWLKGLRLHKYVWLFTNISYDQMLAMDDAYLEKLGVTKGARQKLLLSIKKLNEREETAAALAAELRSARCAASVGRALARLRALLLSPMPPASALPAAIVHALQLASACLSEWCAQPSLAAPAPPSAPPGEESEREPPVEPLSLHCWLVEKALHHESFGGRELQDALKRLRHRLPPRQFYRHVSDMPLKLKPRWRPQPSFGRTLRARPCWPRPGAPAPHTPPLQRAKSHSYPPGAAPPPPPAPPPPDDYSSLDALCLQMTQQAID